MENKTIYYSNENLAEECYSDDECYSDSDFEMMNNDIDDFIPEDFYENEKWYDEQKNIKNRILKPFQLDESRMVYEKYGTTQWATFKSQEINPEMKTIGTIKLKAPEVGVLKNCNFSYKYKQSKKINPDDLKNTKLCSSLLLNTKCVNYNCTFAHSFKKLKMCKFGEKCNSTTKIDFDLYNNKKSAYFCALKHENESIESYIIRNGLVTKQTLIFELSDKNFSNVKLVRQIVEMAKKCCPKLILEKY